jgi:hypothetical protein
MCPHPVALHGSVNQIEVVNSADSFIRPCKSVIEVIRYQGRQRSQAPDYCKKNSKEQPSSDYRTFYI